MKPSDLQHQVAQASVAIYDSSGPRQNKVRKIFASFTPGQKVLDVGCATGSILAPFTNTHEIYGVDISDGLLAKAAEAGPAAAETPELEMRLKVKGTDRRAIVVNAGGGGPRPAVLVLHGGMGSAERMRRDTGFDTLARREGFIVTYPEGTAFGEGRHAWNTGHLLRRQVRDADDIAFLDAVIDRLVAEAGADPARIYVTGGSNGGMMTFVYDAARAEKLAAAAPVVASMFTFDTVPSVPLPILIINGAKDDEVPLEGGMSRNPLVRAAQATAFKPLREVVEFWVKANKSQPGYQFPLVRTVFWSFCFGSMPM